MLDRLCDVVKRIAETEVMPRFLKVSYERKFDGSLFTEADIACQLALVRELSEILPVPVLGEEMDAADQERIWNEGFDDGFWCVDPIDGTTNFIHGLPYFAVSVAYVQHGKTQMGVVYNPVSNELFYARRGEGAFMNGTRLPLKKYTPALRECIAGVEPKWLPGRLPSRLMTLAPFGSQRNLGASTLDWCFVAAGRYDIYLHGGQKLWDYAAGNLILEEAGGVFSTIDQDNYWDGPVWTRSVICALDQGLFKQWQAWVRVNR